MNNPLPILKAKLAPPVDISLVERERLLEMLAPLFTKRLALLVAGAGYGKTTLAAQALRRLNLDGAWYCLDAQDQDPRMFLGYCIHAIRGVHKGFGGELLARLAQPQTRATPAEEFLAAMLLEMQSRIAPLKGHLAIVFDDFHLVQESREVREILEFLLPRLPGNVHCVICGRVAPHLHLSAFRAKREVIDVGERELAFTREETERFCGLQGSALFDREAVDALHADSGGWAAALVLACGGAGKQGARHPLREPDTLSREFVFNYIEENVFLPQPPEIRDFMLATSLLSWLRPEMCDELLDIATSRDILELLARKHLLTFPSGDGGFRYHHLLQEYLRQRLTRQSGKAVVDELHARIGELHAKQGDKQNALLHFRAGDASEAMCALISSMSMDDVTQCSFDLLRGAVASLSEQDLLRHPRVLHLRARLAALWGDLRGAIEDVRKALRRLQEADDVLGVAGCLKDLGFHRYLVGDVRGAYAEMQVLWQTPGLDDWYYSEVGGYLVFFASLLGKFEEADLHHEAALKRISGCRDFRAPLGRIWLGFCQSVRLQAAGDFEAAEVLIEKTLHALREIGAGLMLPIVFMHAALNAFYRRKHEEGLRHAEEGVAMARRLGVSDHQYAWLLYARGCNSLAAGDSPSALRDAYEALEIVMGLENPWAHSSILELLGRISLGKGDAEQAEARMRKALAATESAGFVFWRGMVLAGLAEALLAQERFDEVLALLENGGENEECFTVSTFNLFRRHLLHTVLLLRLGDAGRAGRSLEQALSLARKYGYDGWLSPYLAELAPLVKEQALADENAAYWNSLWRRNGSVEERVSSGASSAPVLTVVPLRIACLGGFRVSVGERRIPKESWRNSKARTLFQYLALSSRKGFTPKDVLLELAWPEEDPALTVKRFHVALHFLRKLLEPGLQRGQRSSYILRRGDAYRLEVGEEGEVDGPRFLAAVERAERAERIGIRERERPERVLEPYLQAEALWTGELLPEEDAADWLVDLRLRGRQKYLKVLSRLMAFLEKEARWRECADYAEKYLALERYSEPAYSTLIRCHVALGDITVAREVFRRCEQAMVHDLGYPLSAETLALRKALHAGPHPREFPDPFD